jgi:hypothetical protein
VYLKHGPNSLSLLTADVPTATEAARIHHAARRTGGVAECGAGEQRGRSSNPSAFAVFRLITKSNFVDCWTGKSAGLSSLRMRPAIRARHRSREFYVGPEYKTRQYSDELAPFRLMEMTPPARRAGYIATGAWSVGWVALTQRGSLVRF